MDLDSYVNSGNFKSLHPILNEWILCIDKFLSEADDRAWWYNERATLSILAAAAWMSGSGNIALEEYVTDKGHKASSYKGRCDLFIGTKSNNYACEAKQIWCSIGGSAKNTQEIIKKGLKSSEKAARKLQSHEGQRLAITFIVPKLPPSDESNIDKLLKLWLKEIRTYECSCIAWTFPAKIRRQPSESSGYFYPGVVMIIQEINRGVHASSN